MRLAQAYQYRPGGGPVEDFASGPTYLSYANDCCLLTCVRRTSINSVLNFAEPNRI